jgi:hypothetical protein
MRLTTTWAPAPPSSHTIIVVTSSIVTDGAGFRATARSAGARPRRPPGAAAPAIIVRKSATSTHSPDRAGDVLEDGDDVRPDINDRAATRPGRGRSAGTDVGVAAVRGDERLAERHGVPPLRDRGARLAGRERRRLPAVLRDDAPARPGRVERSKRARRRVPSHRDDPVVAREVGRYDVACRVRREPEPDDQPVQHRESRAVRPRRRWTGIRPAPAAARASPWRESRANWRSAPGTSSVPSKRAWSVRPSSLSDSPPSTLSDGIPGIRREFTAAQPDRPGSCRTPAAAAAPAVAAANATGEQRRSGDPHHAHRRLRMR